MKYKEGHGHTCPNNTSCCFFSISSFSPSGTSYSKYPNIKCVPLWGLYVASGKRTVSRGIENGNGCKNVAAGKAAAVGRSSRSSSSTTITIAKRIGHAFARFPARAANAIQQPLVSYVCQTSVGLATSHRDVTAHQ